MFPYSRESLVELIGHEPDKFCSEETALWMASRAYHRGLELAVRGGEKQPKIIGLGLTASVATGQPKKGDHKVHIAARTSNGFFVVAATFTKDLLTRAKEGQACDLLALAMLLKLACHEYAVRSISVNISGVESDDLGTFGATDTGSRHVFPQQLPDLYHSSADKALTYRVFWPNSSRDSGLRLDPDTHLLFPGSFNPLHFGHEQMAKQAEQMTGKRVVFSITNRHPDKGIIPPRELFERAEQFRWYAPVLFLDGAGLYIEKARSFPGFEFLIGADAALGILNPSYYGGVRKRNEALAEFERMGTRFRVVGREVDGVFITADNLVVPKKYRQLFASVSGRWDVRSRDLR